MKEKELEKEEVIEQENKQNLEEQDSIEKGGKDKGLKRKSKKKDVEQKRELQNVLEEQEEGQNLPNGEGAEQDKRKKSPFDAASAWAILKKLAKRWFIDAFSGMAAGLFVTLIGGLIIKQIGKLCGDNVVGNMLTSIGNIATLLMGAGIGIGIAHSLKAPKLVMFATAIAGFAGAFSSELLSNTLVPAFMPGNPIGAYVVSVIACEIAMLVSGKTKVDILIVPLTVMVVAIIGCYVAMPAIWFIGKVAKAIEISTAAQPFVMGIIISVTMGILLTMPTSSAAIWISIATGNVSHAMLIAGGASAVGCASHMVGFAVSSFRENKWGGLISQGLGTSMLQIPNIMKKPVIMLPAIIASAILGPISTTVFQLKCGAAAGGMGTSGLVGVIGVFEASAGTMPQWKLWLGIILLMFVLPALISLAVSEVLRKFDIIKFGDMKLEV